MAREIVLPELLIIGKEENILKEEKIHSGIFWIYKKKYSSE